MKPALVEPCRYWMDEINNRCSRPASIIVWGKLFDPDDLGPKCDEHWPQALKDNPGRVAGWAVFDLRGLQR